MLESLESVRAEPGSYVLGTVRVEAGSYTLESVQAETGSYILASVQAEPGSYILERVRVEPGSSVLETVQAKAWSNILESVLAKPGSGTLSFCLLFRVDAGTILHFLRVFLEGNKYIVTQESPSPLFDTSASKFLRELVVWSCLLTRHPERAAAGCSPKPPVGLVVPIHWPPRYLAQLLTRRAGRRTWPADKKQLSHVDDLVDVEVVGDVVER